MASKKRIKNNIFPFCMFVTKISDGTNTTILIKRNDCKIKSSDSARLCYFCNG